jgi:nitrogen fixation protein NifU and related proteins
VNDINQDFLKNNSLEFIEMALRTDKIERIHNPNGYGKRMGNCGDIVEFYLCCEGNTLKSVSFTTQGCLNTIVCSNTVTKFAEGKTIDEAWKITPEQVVEYLKTLPEDHHHCAQLSVGAMYLALADIKSKNSEDKTL